MRYFGGKKRISKKIVEFFEPYLKEYDAYIEPFCGSCAVLEKISKNRIACDSNEYIIEMYKAIQDGWSPPSLVSEEEYRYIKQNKNVDKALTGFVGIGCSFAGKWWGGYARDKRGCNYALDAKSTLLKQKELLSGVQFLCMDYREMKPKNSFIYCDPPYQNKVHGYSKSGFDTDEFWGVIREWSKDNLVFVSEYTAPEDFDCVLSIETRTEIRDKGGARLPRAERLFRIKIPS